jgi:hypothetical protein
MRIKISVGAGNILDYEIPDDVRQVEFEKQKEPLLDMLRNAYEQGPKSERFDADKAWRILTGLSRIFFARASLNQKTMPSWERRERLRDIKKNLGSARRLVERIMRVDVGSDLYSSWCEANPYFRDDPNGIEPIKEFDPVRTKNEFDKALAGLATLEAAASRAAADVRPADQGRPAILPREEIWRLAAVYRNSTGSIPGAGEGPFTEFVVAVLTAQGRYNDGEVEGKRGIGKIKYGGVVDGIKAARRWALMDPAARRWGPSPFDEAE